MQYIDKFIYQFKFPFISSNMYMIVDDDTKNALIIDPHYNGEAAQIMEKAGIRKVTIALTHEHFDHTSGIPWLKEHFNCEIVCHANALEKTSQKRNNRPVLAYMLKDKQENQSAVRDYLRTFEPYEYCADTVCIEQLKYTWNMHNVVMKYAPGHSPASVLIELDKKYVFTGDSLIPDVPVITRFPGGNQELFKTITLPMLKSIKRDCMILPGHGKAVSFGMLSYKDGMFEVKLKEE